MSFNSAFPGTSKSDTKDLLNLLNSPDKAKNMLKRLTAESEKLAELKKELFKGQSADKFAKMKQKEADDAETRAAEAIESIEAEKKKALKSVKMSQTKLSNREKEIDEREVKVQEALNDITKRLSALEEREKLLARREKAAESNIKHAESIRDEYNGKLKDLRERIKGLT